MTPKYKPVNTKALYKKSPSYYHTTAQSFELDQEYPNPPAQKPIAKVANPAKRQRRQSRRKAVVRLGKMRKAERELVFWLVLTLLAKWLIFGF